MINEGFTKETASVTLAAATETQLLGAAGQDITGSDKASIVVKNTGANAIETVTVYLSPVGTLFVASATNYGPIAAGASKLIELDITACSRLKLTGTSASGSTVQIEARGARSHAS